MHQPNKVLGSWQINNSLKKQGNTMSYKHFLTSILVPILRNLQNETQDRNDQVERFNESINTISHHTSSTNCNPSAYILNENDKTYSNLLADALFEVNKDGFFVVHSTHELYTKSTILLNHLIHNQSRTTHYYRGQIDYDWPLTPSIARGTNALSENESDEEQRRLQVFQKKVLNDSNLCQSIFPNRNPPNLEDPDWWGHMQHYEGGTRLIDITSSVFSGLYFACVNFDGSIDTNRDGKLTIFPTSKHWRKQDEDPRTSVFGWTVSSLFSNKDHPTTPRFLQMRDRNERLIAQDGFFLWQPEFSKPLQVEETFDFKIPGTAKETIARELYSMGYTPQKMVRGDKGEDANQIFCKHLNLSTT